MPDASTVLSYYREQTPGMLTMLEELVSRESPSVDKDAVDRVADWLETELAVLPVEVERLGQAGTGDSLRVRRPPDEGTEGRRVLLLTHMDTVCPIGTIDRRPFRLEGNRVTGPGCLDDKNGQVILLTVLQGLRDLEIKLKGTLVALINGDEEIGSSGSRGLIRSEIGQSDYVLSMEPARPDGSLLTSRKAVGRFEMVITGKAAHSGVAPEKGVSAIQELAEQVRELHALSDPARGVMVNVGVVKGGERSNVVAARAEASIDLRAPSKEAGEPVAKKILAAKPHREGIRIEVTGGISRPAFERTPAVVGLFELARGLGGKLGLDLKEASTGGGGDVSFASETGKPALDGLGAVGNSAHSDEEYVLVDSLAERAALLTLLIEHLINQER
jgi:glutamate carboxypeptidase